tara:strand:- start:10743 stop:11384 length:642 start_codon:yes stop_codon:yes gene_type:complete
MTSTIEVLLAARRIADFAVQEGALLEQRVPRPTCQHMGAIIADAILQAGLNYSTVVRPRVIAILQEFPDEITTSNLIRLIEKRQTPLFLNWNNSIKIERFERLVEFLYQRNIEHVAELQEKLAYDTFCAEMQNVNGVGPKTVDYLACLVGLDSIAVDRHIRNFARRTGINDESYKFLHTVFCCAADLLALPRRDFDAWVWSKEASSTQLTLSL